MSVPKACGNAVVRNRIRRVWREAISLVAPNLPAGDYHIMIRNPVLAGSFAAAREMLSSFQRTVASLT
jgi:ribonuclease P protein component